LEQLSVHIKKVPADTDLIGSVNLHSGKDIGTLLPHFPQTKSIDEASGWATLHRTTVPLMVTMRPERHEGGG
jgi:hypothetical protein